jgi:hypothetical protein
MKTYSDLPVRRALQATGDLLLVLWIWLWVSIADSVHDATLGLAKPGRQIDESATGLAGRLRDAGESISGVPVVGDDVQKPFEGAGGAADNLAAAGRAQVEAVQTLAFWLGIAVALIPILIALAVYLPPRIRFVRRATAGRRFLDSAADLDLFALRAMTNQPLHVLARVSDDPAGGWRERDPDVVRRLAALELKDCGLHPPRELVGG